MNSHYKRNGTEGPVIQIGLNYYSEVREMDNEESSRSSSDVPEYNDYVMFDKAQRDKIL
jgi:hypothetical protein